ncbi:hypothetical protein MCOR25_011236 [Pyricularia grisea]|nr:hypothetical protein MCOR25_011236 [Pyricularia grisea]
MSQLANTSHVGFAPVVGFDYSSWYSSCVITGVLVALVVYSMRDKYQDLPHANPNKFTELTTSRTRAEFLVNARRVMDRAAPFKDKPYRVMTDNGPQLVLPPRYVEELKGSMDLSFNKAITEVGHGYLPGLEPIGGPLELPNVVSKHLTKKLSFVTSPISEEASLALQDIFTDSKEWTELTEGKIMPVVARMSSRVFMGQELCNDEKWIKASTHYVRTVFKHRGQISAWPRILRPFAYRFMPASREIQQALQACRDVLQPHVGKRAALNKEAVARGEPKPYHDSLEWFAAEIKHGYDPAIAQITMSLVAIHTTTDLLTQTMADLAGHPELIESLRREVIEVLGAHGLKKAAFQKLVLMDSCFKESQRMRPTFLAFFLRQALVDVKLSDGFVIKKGTKLFMDSSPMMDEEIYPEPHRYNPYRFVEMRKTPGEEAKSHLISSSSSSIS